jgi:hypothetical protein
MWSSVPAWWLAFGRVGLSKWVNVDYLGTHSFWFIIFAGQSYETWTLERLIIDKCWYDRNNESYSQ